MLFTRGALTGNRLKFANYSWLLGALFAVLVIIAWITAYEPVLFNFLISDDFYFITQLHAAKQNPWFLLLHKIDEGTPYYRPFLYVLLFCEYLVFGANGKSLRVISLVYELLTAAVLAILLKNLAGKDKSTSYAKGSINWCLFSAGLFLLYPLHTEPINWFICTNDLMANLFLLCSFLFYIYWRKESNIVFEFISCIFAACAFFTKESTAFLPALITAYEIGTNFSADSTQSSQSKWWLKVSTFIVPTLIHWSILIGYLFVRKIMTGNFFFKESDISFSFHNTQTMCQSWFQSLKIILVPLSLCNFDHGSVFYILWTFLIIGLATLSIQSAFKNRYSAFLMTFMASWFVMCLLPLLKILIITPELLNARYGYLASTPLCAFLTYGLATTPAIKILNFVRYLGFLFIVMLSCFILRTNNLAWAEAGNLINNLLIGFSSINKDPTNTLCRLYFLNIPESYKGIAVKGLRCIESMNNVPFSPTRFNNCVWLSNSDQTLPLGLLRYDIAWGNTYSRFYYWKEADQHFHLVSLPRDIPLGSKKIPYSTLDVHIGGRTQPVQIIDSLGANIKLIKHKSTVLFSPQNLSCWDADMILLKIKFHDFASIKCPKAQLKYTNDFINMNDPIEHLIASLNAADTNRHLFFMLRGRNSWSFGGQCKTVQVSLPKEAALEGIEAYGARIGNQKPDLNILYPGFDKDTGIFELNNKYPQLTICYDSSLVKNCAGVSLEVIGPGDDFKELNSPNSDQQSIVPVTMTTPSGRIVLTNNLFPNAGLYKVRLRPIDIKHIQTGFCSDHFILHVSK
jgi:hypothetical protein